MLKLLSLIAKTFIWNEVSFPAPSSNRTGVIWFLSCLMQIIINFASLIYWRIFLFHILRLSRRQHRALGRFLVLFAIFGIGSVVLSFYLCLLPLRLNRWHDGGHSSEFLLIIIHVFFGLIVLANIVVHYISGVLCSPGIVDPIAPLSIEIPWTMCSQCQRPRPLRAHHCGICGVCVLRMDHHCPWLNNCVGLRTHRNFILFLAHLSFGIIYLYLTSFTDYIEHMRHKCNESNPGYSRFNCMVHSFVGALYRVSALVFLLAVGLLIWHGRLITRGETSVERVQNARTAQILQHRYNRTHRNPFDFGPRTNWYRFLGLEEPKSRFSLPQSVKYRWKRFLLHVLLPLPIEPYDGDGMIYETRQFDLENALSDLKGLG